MPPAQPPLPWPDTEEPWSRIRVDFAGPVEAYMVVHLGRFPHEVDQSYPDESSQFGKNNRSTADDLQSVRLAEDFCDRQWAAVH